MNHGASPGVQRRAEKEHGWGQSFAAGHGPTADFESLGLSSTAGRTCDGTDHR